MTGDRPGSVTCEFFALNATDVFAVVSAVTDQMCAQADVDAVLLSAIEAPLGETIDALSRGAMPITSATASVDQERRLRLDIVVDNGPRATSESLFGDAHELIDAFFDIDVEPDVVRLSLDLD